MEEEKSTVDWMGVAIKNRFYIGVAAIICGIVALAASFVMPKTYQSGLVLKVGHVTYMTTKSTGVDQVTVTEPIETVETVQDMIRSEPFAAEVVSRLKLETTPKRLLKRVKVKINQESRPEEGNRQLIITTKSNTSEGAVQLGQAIAGLLIERHGELFNQAMEVHNNYEKNLDGQITRLSSEIEALESTLRRVYSVPKVDAPAVILLQAAVHEKEAHLTNLKRERSQAMIVGHTRLKAENTFVEIPPYKPLGPVNVSPPLSGLIGILLGSMIGLLFFLYRSNLGRDE